MPFRDELGQALAELYEAKKPEGFTRIVGGEIDSGKINVDAFSLKELAEATRYPRTIAERARMIDAKEAVDFTTFPTITQKVIQQMTIPGYDMVAHQSSRCCMEIPETEGVETLRYPGLTTFGSLKQRAWTGKYTEATAAEKYVQRNVPQPWGRIVSLKDVDIMRDRVGLLKLRATAIGTAAGNVEEKEFFYALSDVGTNLDVDHTTYAYYPAGTQTAIYSTSTTADTDGMTPRNSAKTSNALSDATDVQNADALLALQTDENGDPIQIYATRLICPRALAPTARKIRAGFIADKSKNGGVVPTSYVGGFGDDQADFDIVATPFLDLLSTSTWFWGAPERAFIRAVVYPLQTLAEEIGAPHPKYMEEDVVFQARARWLKVTMALDYRYVVKSTS